MCALFWGKTMYQTVEKFKSILKTIPIPYLPAEADVFKAFERTAKADLKIVWMGQDPYPNKSDATGLSFSVPKDSQIPPSLRNIYACLKEDTGISPPHGNLEGWAKQGVLLVNRSLTVRPKEPGSHEEYWISFMPMLIQELNAGRPLIFILMGQAAQSLKPLIDRKHLIIETVHPSPLSAWRGFKQSKLFLKIRSAQQKLDQPLIDFSRFD